MTAEPLEPRAGEAYAEAARFVRSHRCLRLVADDGESVELPEEVTDALDRVVTALAAGQRVSVLGADQLISTTQAAEILGVSRPTLVRFLEAGEIAYAQPGTHRRLKLSDVLEFHETRRRRLEILNQMTRDAVELGLYDLTAEDYAAANEAIREERRAGGNGRDH